MVARLARGVHAGDSMFYIWVSPERYQELVLDADKAYAQQIDVWNNGGGQSPAYDAAVARTAVYRAERDAATPYVLTNTYPGVVVGLDNTIRVDDEIVSVMFLGSGVVSVQRGLFGTARASHPAGTELVIAPYAGVGETGPTGPTGSSGTGGGNAWLAGSGNPSDVLGVDSDFYLDVSTGNVWQKDSGTWGV